jgi:hypothetical protein
LVTICFAASLQAWNLDALGAAAEVGVDVFCRETLAGDWLEVIALWQKDAGTVLGFRQENVTRKMHFFSPCLLA